MRNISYYLKLFSVLVIFYSGAIFFPIISMAGSVPPPAFKCGNESEDVFGRNVFLFNLGEDVNSKYDDYNTVFNSDFTTMLFTSRRDSTTGEKIYVDDGAFYEDIMVSTKDDLRFRKANMLRPDSKFFPLQVNTNKHEAPVWLSHDESLLIIYKQDKLWYSNKGENGYSEPVAYGPEINVNKYTRHASITEDGKTMYFSSEVFSPNGAKSQYDIYVSERTESGGWSVGKPLEGPINSEKDEDSPEISKDGKTMYFSSNKKGGLGGYDIYKSELIDGLWTEPVNLCAPINSAANDVFFKLSDDKSFAYLSSNRLGGHGGLDIYKVIIDEPEFRDCKPYSEAMKAEGLFMEGRDTIGEGQTVIIDGSNSTFRGKEPQVWNWKYGSELITNEEQIEPQFTEPGRFDISLQISTVNQDYFRVDHLCATKTIDVIEEETYFRMTEGQIGLSNLKAMVGQDELLLTLDGSLGSNPFDLIPESENTFINTPLEIYVLDNDNHPMGSVLRLDEVGHANNGLSSIKDKAAGVVYYKPAKGFTGIDKFYYYVVDDQGKRAKSYVAIQVLSEADYLQNQSSKSDVGTVKKDSSVTMNVFANDAGVNTSARKIARVSQPSNGKVEILNGETGELKYAPNKGFVGTDMYTYSPIDENGKESSAAVKVLVGEVLNEKLIANEDYKYTKAGVSVTINPLGNDVQEDDLPITLVSTSQPANGSVKIINPLFGTVLYYPRRGFDGLDVFTYTIRDTEGNKNMAAVTVVVVPASSDEVLFAKSDNATTKMGVPVLINLFENDNQKTASKIGLYAIDNPANGSIVIKDSASGTIQYKPDAGFKGVDNFSYTIANGSLKKAKAIVSVEVIGADEEVMTLTLANDFAETQINEVLEFNLFTNDKHSHGKPFTITSFDQPKNGKVVIVDNASGLIRYTPKFKFVGKDEFAYSASDAKGNKGSATAQISVMAPIVLADVNTKDLPSLDLKSIYFDFDKAFVRSDARSTMDENIRILKENPNLIIKVLSYCDSWGDSDYNVILSERRAKATVKYMIDNGISKERIIAVLGLGETKLVNDCGDGVPCPKADHQMNRRSDFQIVGKTDK